MSWKDVAHLTHKARTDLGNFVYDAGELELLAETFARKLDLDLPSFRFGSMFPSTYAAFRSVYSEDDTLRVSYSRDGDSALYDSVLVDAASDLPMDHSLPIDHRNRLLADGLLRAVELENETLIVRRGDEYVHMTFNRSQTEVQFTVPRLPQAVRHAEVAGLGHVGDYDVTLRAVFTGKGKPANEEMTRVQADHRLAMAVVKLYFDNNFFG